MARALASARFVAAAAFALLLAGCAGGGTDRTSRDPNPVSAPSASVKAYPLETCLVTGTTLGSMGDPITKVYGDQEVRFCCDPCIAEFEASPEKFLEALRK